MIIPVRCFTCNRPIGAKYKKYQEMIKELNLQSENIISGDPNIDLSKKTPYQEVFDKLGVDRYCCKRHLLTNVDLIEKI